MKGQVECSALWDTVFHAFQANVFFSSFFSDIVGHRGVLCAHSVLYICTYTESTVNVHSRRVGIIIITRFMSLVELIIITCKLKFLRAPTLTLKSRVETASAVKCS